jgi:hypothetical protein
MAASVTAALDSVMQALIRDAESLGHFTHLIAAVGDLFRRFNFEFFGGSVCHSYQRIFGCVSLTLADVDDTGGLPAILEILVETVPYVSLASGIVKNPTVMGAGDLCKHGLFLVAVGWGPETENCVLLCAYSCRQTTCQRR